MTLSTSNPRARQRWLGLLGIIGVAMVLVAGTAIAASGTDASVADYSQCANGKPGTSVPTTDCDGWIFGILNPNNSQYAEDQVTAQRLILDLPRNGATTGRTIQLKWLVRKGVHHAYDSLATWNKTQTTADPCQSLNTPSTTACTASLADKSVLPIPADSSIVTPNSGVGTAATSDHQLAGQQLEMYGLGTSTGIDSMVYGNLVDESGDLYQSATITYHVANLTSARKVMLLFGGHLAAGGGPRSWGAGNGASDISGGPYHIKLIKVDGSSIGNRDNQIMSSAILPLSVVVTTELHQTDAAGADLGTANNGASITVNLPADGTGAYVKDVATASDAGASGTIAFKYYPSLADCTADTNAVSAGGGALSGGSAGSSVVLFSSPGTFYWRAFLTGSDITEDTASACGDEVLTLRQRTTAATTLHERASSAGTADVNPANNGKNITVFPGAFVNDTVSVSPAAATGTVAFKTYATLADCGADTNGTGRGSALALSANSDTVQFNSTGTFYWRAFFTGTNGNLDSSSPCTASDNESVTVRTVATSLNTSPKAFPNDSATVSATLGGNVAGSVEFKMYDSFANCDANGAAGLLFSDSRALPGDATSSTVTTRNGDLDDAVPDYSVDSDATVWWRVSFTSTNANQAGRNSLCLEKTAIDHTADSSGGTAP
jgi:hypothetical protein